MIIKNKILSNEIIKRKLGIIDSKDKYLFKKDFKKKICESYVYHLKNKIVFGDGKIGTLNHDILSDYLSYNSLSKFIFLKKIILKCKYFIEVLYQNVFLKQKHIKNNCVIIYNRNSYGYFHWVLDTLPKILYAKKINANFTFILPESLKQKFIIDSLKKFNIKFIFIKRDYKYLFENITYIGELYPSGSPRKEVLENLRKNIKFKKKNIERIYISRNKSNRRKIINENALIKILKKYKFKILYTEKIKFKRQIEIFSKANLVIGLHGAGITNIVWMKKNSQLFEIKPEKDLFLNCYFNLANALKINYHYLICKKHNYFSSSKNSNYEVNIGYFEKQLKKIINEK